MEQPRAAKGPEAPAPATQNEAHADWTTLLKNGFTYLGDWRMAPDGGLELDRKAPKESGVYAFVLDDQVVYIGITQRGLHLRMADYRRGHRGQKTSSHVKKLILTALGAGQNLRILVATPQDSDWKGLPVVTSAGLEVGLIRALRPAWNRQGKG